MYLYIYICVRRGGAGWTTALLVFTQAPLPMCHKVSSDWRWFASEHCAIQAALNQWHTHTPLMACKWNLWKRNGEGMAWFTLKHMWFRVPGLGYIYYLCVCVYIYKLLLYTHKYLLHLTFTLTINNTRYNTDTCNLLSYIVYKKKKIANLQ